MISTSCITGTGFMKCMPMTCAGRFVRAAISVIEIELVLEARIAVASASRSSSAKILNLRSAFSVAASIANVAPFTAPRSPLVETRASAASRVAASIEPFLIWRSKFFSMLARPFARAASDTSIIVTGSPALAQTWAMPLPICPAPITAITSLIRHVSTTEAESYFPLHRQAAFERNAVPESNRRCDCK